MNQKKIWVHKHLNTVIKSANGAMNHETSLLIYYLFLPLFNFIQKDFKILRSRSMTIIKDFKRDRGKNF